MATNTFTIGFRIGGWHNRGVEQVKVVRKTPQTIILLESWMDGPERPVKSILGSHGYEYFETFPEAKEALIGRRRRALESARQQVETAGSALDAALSLTDPSNS